MAENTNRTSLTLSEEGFVQGQIEIPTLFTGAAFSIPVNVAVKDHDTSHWDATASALEKLADYLRQTAATMRSEGGI